jgi:hypothetical protein
MFDQLAPERKLMDSQELGNWRESSSRGQQTFVEAGRPTDRSCRLLPNCLPVAAEVVLELGMAQQNGGRGRGRTTLDGGRRRPLVRPGCRAQRYLVEGIQLTGLGGR